MIEAGQSNLVTLVAGAVLASCLVAVGALESARAEDATTQSVIDRLAAQIAEAECSARHPESTINLSSALDGLPDSVAELALLPDHLRAKADHGASFASVEFPALAIENPVELKGRTRLTLSFDFVSEFCTALAV